MFNNVVLPLKIVLITPQIADVSIIFTYSIGQPINYTENNMALLHRLKLNSIIKNINVNGI
jgi:hypothetical protein